MRGRPISRQRPAAPTQPTETFVMLAKRHPSTLLQGRKRGDRVELMRKQADYFLLHGLICEEDEADARLAALEAEEDAEPVAQAQDGQAAVPATPATAAPAPGAAPVQGSSSPFAKVS